MIEKYTLLSKIRNNPNPPCLGYRIQYGEYDEYDCEYGNTNIDCGECICAGHGGRDPRIAYFNYFESYKIVEKKYIIKRVSVAKESKKNVDIFFNRCIDLLRNFL